MDHEHELPRFMEWLAALGGKKPIRDEKVYAKVFAEGEQPPRMGYKRFQVFSPGTLSVWDDALVFIGSSPTGYGKFAVEQVVSEAARKATHGIANLAVAIGQSVFGKTSTEELIEMVLNPYSFFIPLSRIDKIEGGRGIAGFNGKLDFHYTDFAGERVQAVFLGEFTGWSLRRTVEKAMAK